MTVRSKPDDPEPAGLPHFAVKLKSLRESAGLTQGQLADKAGLHLGAVFKLEQGRRQPSWETVQALATALGVSCEAFTQEPAARESSGPGRPRKAPAVEPNQVEEKPPTEQPKRPKKRKPGK